MNKHIDQLCDEFEKALKAGDRPDIGHALSQVPDAFQAYLFRELMMLDLEYRLRDGEEIAEEHYTSQFPKYGSIIADTFLEITRFEFEASSLYETRTRKNADAQVRIKRDSHEAIHYFGDYELVEKIAQGGMGIVYKARQISLNRIVAVKMILSGQLASKDDVQRFQIEAEAAARLDHPNIVPIYEVGKHEDQHYFSMGYVEGDSLAAMIRSKSIERLTAIKLFKTVTEAISYAHAKGVIHRDLKPSNILLDAEGQPRVTDFGLAKQVESDSDLTATGQILGTPSYMSPEQADGSATAIGPLADVYSLGAVLYELLSGRPPFQASTAVGTLKQVMEREPDSLRDLDPNIPRDLETICLKCLQKSPQSRYDSAEQLTDELGRFLSGEPIRARPVTTTERTWRWCKRNRLAAGLIAAVFLVLVTGVAVSTFLAVLANHNAKVANIEKGRADKAAVEANRNAAVANTEKDRADKAAAEAELNAEEAERNAEEAKRNAEEARRNAADAERNAEEASISAAKEKEARQLIQYQLRQIKDAQHGRQIADAQRAWQKYDMIEADRILEQVLPEFRDRWGTRHLQTIIRRKALTLRGHEGVVFAAQLSNDGKLIASGSADKTIKIWDAITGEEKRTLHGHASYIRCVNFNKDNKQVVSGSGNSIKVWDVLTGQELRTLGGHTDNVSAVSFSNNGKQILSSSSDGTIRIWDAESGREIRTITGHKGAVTGSTFGMDDKRIVSVGQDGTIRVWDAETGSELLKIRALPRSKHIHVSIASDGKRIVCGSRDNTIKVWNAETGQEQLTLHGHKGRVTGVALSSDGKRIASTSYDMTVKLWDATTGREILTIRGHKSGARGVSLSHDGQRIISAGSYGTVKIWDTNVDHEKLTLRGHKSPVVSVSVSGDGKRIVSAGHHRISNASSIKVWDAETGREMYTLKNKAGGFKCVSLSNDGKYFVSGGWDKSAKQLDATVKGWPTTVKVWDTSTGQQLFSLPGHIHVVESVNFSPDGKKIVSSGQDRTIRLWNLETRQQELTLAGPKANIYHASFSGDGKRIVSLSYDRTIRVWDAKTGQQLNKISGRKGHLLSAKLSSDGKRLAGGTEDGSITLWDTETGEEIFTFRAHQASVTSVHFSRDGERIISGSKDGTVKISAVETGQELITLSESTGKHVLSASRSGDGKRIVSGRDDGAINVWDAELIIDQEE